MGKQYLKDSLLRAYLLNENIIVLLDLDVDGRLREPLEDLLQQHKLVVLSRALFPCAPQEGATQAQTSSSTPNQILNLPLYTT